MNKESNGFEGEWTGVYWRFDGKNKSEDIVTEIQTQVLTWRKGEYSNICKLFHI